MIILNMTAYLLSRNIKHIFNIFSQKGKKNKGKLNQIWCYHKCDVSSWSTCLELIFLILCGWSFVLFYRGVTSCCSSHKLWYTHAHMIQFIRYYTPSSVCGFEVPSAIQYVPPASTSDLDALDEQFSGKVSQCRIGVWIQSASSLSWPIGRSISALTVQISENRWTLNPTLALMCSLVCVCVCVCVLIGKSTA